MESAKKFIKEYQIIAALLVIIVGWLIVQLHEVLIGLFIAYIVMAALHPLVKTLVEFKIPKPIAVAFTYIITLAVVIVLVIPLIPFFTTQISRLFVTFPIYISRASEVLGIRINSELLNEVATSELGNVGRNALGITTQIFGGVFSLLTTFVISFYMLLDRERIIRETTHLFPVSVRTHIEETVHLVEEKLGAWVRGQVVLSLFIGLITWVILTVIGLPFALPLAVLAGMLEIVPTIGPIIAAIPAIIVALNVSGPMAILVILVYIIIQILENNILVPRIMQRAVGLNPIVVIAGVIAGGKILGIIGALLSVPFITMMIVLIHALRKQS